MKILHLYSDWKWTGPAEPVVQMCAALRERGHEVLLAHSPDAHANRESVGAKARDLGVPATSEFALNRYLRPLPTLRDMLRLPAFLRRERFDIVHMHLNHDHVEGALCAKLLGRRAPVLVRTLHSREVLPANLGYRLQLRQLTDGWLMFTEKFRAEYARRFRLPEACTGLQPMSVDLERFRPDRTWKNLRAEFGVTPETPLIGIVGRYQKYRRMDLFMAAAKQLLDKLPEARFVVIGRSSQMQQTVIEPAEALGIRDRLILTGYRIDDYADILAALDLFTLLMPGFDGTARAVREAMALAVPCVLPDFGMLPEICPHDSTGLIVPREDPAALAAAWLELLQNPPRRRALGANARREAEARFGMNLVGPALETFYSRLLARP